MIIFTFFFLLFCAGVSELVRAVTQSGHLVGDTIVQGSATSHMVPVEQADGKIVFCERYREMISVYGDFHFLTYLNCSDPYTHWSLYYVHLANTGLDLFFASKQP